MRGIIVDTLEFVLSITVLLIIVVFCVAGVATEYDIQLFGRQQDWRFVYENAKLVGGAIGVVLGVMASSLVFGVLFILLDIRAQLIEANRLTREANKN